MINWFKENWELIAVYIFLAVVVAGIITGSIFLVKWIVESDLPDWLKFWLLMG